MTTSAEVRYKLQGGIETLKIPPRPRLSTEVCLAIIRMDGVNHPLMERTCQFLNVIDAGNGRLLPLMTVCSCCAHTLPQVCVCVS